jgi:streptogramin lyase
VWLAPVLAAAELNSTARALQLAAEAAAAAEANDLPGRLARLEEAVRLRPDFPSLLPDLAAAQVAAGQSEAAIATLGRVAELGLHTEVERSVDFAALRLRADFQAVAKRLAANLHPRGRGETAFALRDVTGLIEAVAWREETGEFYFADSVACRVWRRDRDGRLHAFSPADEGMSGVQALVMDEAGGVLWAATAAALVELDLATGAVRRTLAFPRVAGEPRRPFSRALTRADDGSVFLLDQEERALWRLAPGAAALSAAFESGEFLAPAGIVALPGGVVIVADRSNGLLRVDWGRNEVRRMAGPETATLADIVSITLAPDGALLAVQAGLRPSRVLRLELDATADAVIGVDVLESGHLAMSAPGSGCLGPGGFFFFLGNTGATRPEFRLGQPTAPRLIPVFRTRPVAAPR